MLSFINAHKSDLENIATAVRCISMDAVLKAKSGHLGLPLGGAEIGTLLYFVAMNHTAQSPRWFNRDRFVLSAGHGSMLQYSLLHLAGYDVSREDLANFRQLGSKTPGHPEYGHTQGVETTTGPLGQGIATAVGMAIAERMKADRFNDAQTELINHRTFVVAGDGCLMEGVASEACSLAGHLKLNKLVVFYDANRITIDGHIDITFTENVAKRFESYGWQVLHADGHCFESLGRALEQALANSNHDNKGTEQKGPTLIVCSTRPGRGSPKWEGNHKIHGNPMTAEDVIEAKKHLGLLDTAPFALPKEFQESARALSALRAQKFADSDAAKTQALARWKQENDPRALLWDAIMEENPAARQMPAHLQEQFWAKGIGKMATRVSGGKAFSLLAQHNTALVGGSADLAGSNMTTLPEGKFVCPTDFSGRNIHFGIREHAMGAIANGLALHGGFQPFCATFAVFSDYMRPSIRLAALMKVPTIFVFTHDSYAVGEDGPTHQPVEHAAALRAIPDLNVLRPGDAKETFAAWKFAQEQTSTPTVLLLSRQDLPDLDDEGVPRRSLNTLEEGMQKGAYILQDFSEKNQGKRLVITASGSEVSLAVQTAQELIRTNPELNIRVVSCPAPQKLAQNKTLLDKFVPAEIPTVAIEAGVPQGWGEIVGRSGLILGMQRFGASAPANRLAEYFGFTPQACANAIRKHLGMTE